MLSLVVELSLNDALAEEEPMYSMSCPHEANKAAADNRMIGRIFLFLLFIVFAFFDYTIAFRRLLWVFVGLFAGRAPARGVELVGRKKYMNNKKRMSALLIGITALTCGCGETHFYSSSSGSSSETGSSEGTSVSSEESSGESSSDESVSSKTEPSSSESSESPSSSVPSSGSSSDPAAIEIKLGEPGVEWVPNPYDPETGGDYEFCRMVYAKGPEGGKMALYVGEKTSPNDSEFLASGKRECARLADYRGSQKINAIAKDVASGRTETVSFSAKDDGTVASPIFVSAVEDRTWTKNDDDPENHGEYTYSYSASLTCTAQDSDLYYYVGEKSSPLDSEYNKASGLSAKISKSSLFKMNILAYCSLNGKKSKITKAIFDKSDVFSMINSESDLEIGKAIGDEAGTIEFPLSSCSLASLKTMVERSPLFDSSLMTVSYSEKGGNAVASLSYDGKDAPSSGSGQGRNATIDVPDVTLEANEYGASNWDVLPIEGSRESVLVRTGEQLWKAAESGYNPIPRPNSPAEKIYAVALKILKKEMPDSSSDVEIAASAYRAIGMETCYDYKLLSLGQAVNPDVMRGHFIDGALLDGIAVCDGLSKAYSLLLNMAGVRCGKISGKSKTTSSGHAWDVAFVEGGWRNVNPTAANSSATKFTEIVDWSDFLKAPSYMLTNYALRDGYELPDGEDYAWFVSDGLSIENEYGFSIWVDSMTKAGKMFSSERMVLGYSYNDAHAMLKKVADARSNFVGISANFDVSTEVMTAITTETLTAVPDGYPVGS